LHDFNRAPLRPPARRIGRSEDHNARQARPRRQVAHAGIIADIGRGAAAQVQQIEAVRRAMDGCTLVFKPGQEVVIRRADHELGIQTTGSSLSSQLQETCQRPTFARAAGAGMQQDGL